MFNRHIYLLTLFLAFNVHCYANLKEPLRLEVFDSNKLNLDKDLFIFFNVKLDGIDSRKYGGIRNRPSIGTQESFIRYFLESKLKYNISSKKIIITRTEPELLEYMTLKRIDANFLFLSINYKDTWINPNPFNVFSFLTLGLIPVWNSFDIETEAILYDHSGTMSRRSLKSFRATEYMGLVFLPFFFLFDYSNYNEPNFNLSQIQSLIIKTGIENSLSAIFQETQKEK